MTDDEFKAKRAALQRKWAKNNPDKIKRINDEQYYKNQASRIEYSRKYRKNNAEKVRQTQRNHRAKNPGWAAACSAKRKSRKLSQTPAHANSDWIAEIYAMAARIRKCTGLDFEVDHIYPLCKGGEHHEANLQILPAILNIKKHDYIPAICLV